MNLNYSNRRMKLRWTAFVILIIFYFNGFRVNAQSCSPPGASIATPGIITCGNRTITLEGSSPVTAVYYTWTKPDNSLVTSQNLSVSLPGTYTLTVTTLSGGCTSSASVVVLEDTAQPDARTSVSGIITCASPTVAVNGLSSTPITTFRWIGPGSFTSTQQNLNISTYGGYTLMVTSSVNGCTSTATAYVGKNVELPLASAYVSGDLTCSVNSVQLTSSSPTSGVSYSWSGPGFGSPVLAQNTTTSVGGAYIVTTTNPVNGCVSTAVVNVVQNIAPPGANITASADIITCATINSNLSGSSPSSGVTYTWTGPGLNVAVQNITVATAGSYVLTVTKAQNSCISKDTVVISVDKNRPDASGTPSGAITCSTSTITLNGSSITSGVTYKWIGPSGFGTVYTQNPTTTFAGGYVLSVTKTNNGCITTKPVVVQQNVIAPASVTATPNGVITCAVASVTLTGYSSTSGVTYAWIGPNSTTYTGTTPSVNQTGTYTLTVTNPVNGCSASTSTSVLQDKALPASVSAINDGAITCTKTSAILSGSSSTQGVTYEWRTQAGAFVASIQNAVVTTSGLYRLYVTSTSNGCTATTLTNLGQNVAKPALIAASNGGPLTCSLVSTRLNASSSTAGVSYRWSGPGNFSSTALNPIVNMPGAYKVVVTNTQNGCTDSTSTILAQDVDLPGASIATVQAITCSNTSVTLSAGSPTQGVTYNWTGPGTFSSSEQNPLTNEPGNYTVTVTNSVNSCTSTASTSVTQDTITPTGVTASAPDSLTCTRASVSLVASLGTGNVSFGWTGPNGFTSSSQNPIVTAKGQYILTVTKQSNGCWVTANTNVVKDSILPQNVNANVSGILNCLNSSVTLTGSSSTPGVGYHWVGPGVNSTSSTVSASATGAYNLTITNTHNGCMASSIVNVTEDHTLPAAVSASASGILTCNNPNRTVTATTSTGDVEFSWTGPHNFASNEQTPTVSDSGVYHVVVTHAISRCSVTRTATVILDTIRPVNVNAQASGFIMCNSRSVTLTGSTTSSPVTYSWDGPGGYTSNDPMPIVSRDGLYTLTVTKTLNGCSQTRTVVVEADTTLPTDVTAEVSNNLDCNNSIAILTGSSTTPEAEFEWDYQGGAYDMNAVTFTVLEGDYTLIVTNPLNGCTDALTVSVVDDHNPPVCSLDVPDNSTVMHNTANTINALYSPSYSYTWSITNWEIISGQGSQTMAYMSGNAGTTSRITVLIIDANNGCNKSCSVNLSTAELKSAYVSPEDLLSVHNDVAPANKLTDGKATELTLKAYPVPSSGEVFIEFASNEPTEATITVYNINGSAVASLFSNKLESGLSYKLSFNQNRKIPAGAYVCVLKSRTKTLYNNIIIK